MIPSRRLPASSRLWSLALAGSLLGPLPALAGGFLPLIGDAPLAGARVLTSEGRWLLGEVQARTTNTHGITRITLREADGTRHKMDSKEVEQIVVPLSGALRRAAFAESTSTVEKLLRDDSDWQRNASEVTFDSIAWPDPTRRVILQRVNPGFDHAIRVYAVENWKEGTVSVGDFAVSGDEPKAFLVVKNGGAPIKVSKRNYDERFPELFGDCPEFVARVPEKQRELSRFADQLRAYDQECAPPAPVTATE